MFRSTLRILDRSLLGGTIRKAFYATKLAQTKRSISKRSKLTSTVYHVSPNSSLIAQLCDKYGSDKDSERVAGVSYASAPHTYAWVYSSLFEHCRHEFRKVFECGIGTTNVQIASNMGSGGKPGASLRVWRDYFPNATIFGADIDQSVLFGEDRIATFHVDQTDPTSVFRMWRMMGEQEFDLMIDDGLHEFAAGVCLFENSRDKLREGGVYVIEDIQLRDLLRYHRYFHEQRLSADFFMMVQPFENSLDNSLIVLRKQ